MFSLPFLKMNKTTDTFTQIQELSRFSHSPSLPSFSILPLLLSLFFFSLSFFVIADVFFQLFMEKKAQTYSKIRFDETISFLDLPNLNVLSHLLYFLLYLSVSTPLLLYNVCARTHTHIMGSFERKLLTL